MTSLRAFLNYLVNPTTRFRNRDVEQAHFESADLDSELAAPSRGVKANLRLLNLPLLLGSLIVAGLIAIVLIGPLFSSQDPFVTTIPVVPYWDSENKELVTPPFSPSDDYPMGTDQWGNDMLSLLLYGARVTLVVAFYITFLRFGIGLILGGVAGWRQDSVADRLVMGLIAAVTAVPLLLSGMVLILVLDIQKGPAVFIIALAAVGWTEVAQAVRGELLVIRRQLYIEAARATGLSELQMVVRHALPNILPQLLVVAALEMGAVLLLLAELAFIGIYIGGESHFTQDPVFGGRPVPLMETPEWGVMIAQGRNSLRSNPHLIIGPALAFFVAILGLNMMGEGLRRLLDRRPINTSFLLTKKMLAIIAAVAVLSYALIALTGPKQSFARVASEFRGDLAFERVKTMFQLAQQENPDGNETSQLGAYIADNFRDLGLERGHKEEVFSSYFYDQDESSHVMGFWPGYDTDLSNQFIVVLTRHGLADEPTANERLSGLAVVLESLRVLAENELDPRRSLLFVSWSDETVDLSELSSFFENNDNFKRLPVPTNLPNHVVAVIQVDNLGNGDEVLWVDPRSDEDLRSVLTKSASAEGVPLTSQYRFEQDIITAAETDIPSLYFQWLDPAGPLTSNIVGQERLSQAGEVLTRLLLEMVRPPKY